MWILRYHLLTPKHYNKVSRLCQKHGFKTRTHSPVLYAKASIKHLTQKNSFRSLSREYAVSHITLHSFFSIAKNSDLLSEIFHVFLEWGIVLFIGDMRHINIGLLENNPEIYELTKVEIESMMKSLTLNS